MSVGDFRHGIAVICLFTWQPEPPKEWFQCSELKGESVLNNVQTQRKVQMCFSCRLWRFSYASNFASIFNPDHWGSLLRDLVFDSSHLARNGRLSWRRRLWFEQSADKHKQDGSSGLPSTLLLLIRRRRGSAGWRQNEAPRGRGQERRRRDHATANEPRRFCCSPPSSLLSVQHFPSPRWAAEWLATNSFVIKSEKTEHFLITLFPGTRSQGNISSSAALHKPHV